MVATFDDESLYSACTYTIMGVYACVHVYVCEDVM